MMVVMTSLAPVRALRNPGMKPQKAPVSTPHSVETRMIRNIGCSLSAIAAVAAPNAPRTNWPSTPMLNAPLRNETATARPVRISGSRRPASP